MDKQQRYLITTSDEQTWYQNKPIVFLGEWCRLYERQILWKNLDAKVVSAYGRGEEQKTSDFSYLGGLYEQLLLEVSETLNNYHNTNHSLRYWRILIGPWLNSFTNILFNRWSTIQLALQEFEIAGTKVFNFSAEQMIPNSQVKFEEFLFSNQWNHYIYGRILSGWTTCPYELIDPQRIEEVILDENHNKHLSIKSRIRSFLAKRIDWFSGILSQSSDAFFINTYIPRKHDLLLQFSLGQIPKIWRTPKEPKFKADMEIRKKFQLTHEKFKGFEHCIRKLIVEQIPVLYLEGYQVLMNEVSNMPWPKNPKVIFTSNSAHNDEIFKAWTAMKVEYGTPYVFGQHGGTYGMGRYPTPFEIREVETADLFLTWGWADGSSKHYPSAAITIIGKPFEKSSKNGGLLLETFIALRYTRDSWDISSQQAEYLEDQFKFVKQLPEDIQRKTTIRLSQSDKSHGYSREEIWKARYPAINIDIGFSPIESLIRRSKLIVHTANSTGLLEVLARNIPTIAFWIPKHWEYRPSAQQYFQRLELVGILHYTPESAAKKIASIWENVDEWWSQKEVQEARIYFCNRFANIPKNPIKVLKVALQSVLQN